MIGLTSAAKICGVSRTRMYQIYKDGRIKGASMNEVGLIVLPLQEVIAFSKIERPDTGGYRWRIK